MEQVGDVFCQSCKEHRAVSRIYLHHACIVLADGTRHLRIFQQDGCGNLEESHLVDKDLVIGVIVTLHHIDLFLYRLVDFLYLLLVTPHRNGVLVNVLDTAGRYIQTLNIHLSASKHGCNLIQNTGNVLRINKQCI